METKAEGDWNDFSSCTYSEKMVTERCVGAKAGTLGLPDVMVQHICAFSDLTMIAAASASSSELDGAMKRCKKSVVEGLLFKHSPRTAKVRWGDFVDIDPTSHLD